MRQAGWYMIRTRKGWKKCFYSDGWNCSLPVIEVAEPDKRLDQIDLMLQITALQSQCTDKDSRIAGLIYATEQWEKKCTEKDQEIEKIKMARESYKSQAEHFSDSLEELKAENERLKKSLEFRISRS